MRVVSGQRDACCVMREGRPGDLRVPPSYALVGSLKAGLEWANLLHVYYELCGERVQAFEPKELGRALKRTVRELEKIFPVYVDYAEMVAEDIAQGGADIFDGCPPLEQFVIFQGLSMEKWWQDWDLVSQLIMAIFAHGDYSPYAEEIAEWWGDLRLVYAELPELSEIDLAEVMGRLEPLPSPWDGLWATFQWFEGVGNCFVDIAPEYADQMWCGVAWSMESVRDLQRQYEWARREIFEPAAWLAALVDGKAGAFSMCLGLCFGCEYMVQDGELIEMGSREWGDSE